MEYEVSDNRILSDEMAAHHEWLDAARDMRANDWELEDEVADQAERLKGLVLAEIVSVADLRGGVAWTNALDREAVQKSGGKIEALKGDDADEAWARRIAHHAGRKALNSVKSKRLQGNAYAERARQLSGRHKWLL